MTAVTGALAFGCECGAVAGEVSATGVAKGRRYVCHCKDCQAFAHHCDAAERTLDRNAGTGILQAPAAEVRLIRGRESLAAVHLTDGPLVRWSCANCDGPIVNTLASPNWAFFSLILGPDNRAQLDAAGKTARHVFTEDGCGDLAEVDKASLFSMMLPILAWMAAARLRGSKHPMFDGDSGAPLAEPRRIGSDERAEIDRKAAAYRMKICG